VQPQVLSSAAEAVLARHLAPSKPTGGVRWADGWFSHLAYLVRTHVAALRQGNWTFLPGSHHVSRQTGSRLCGSGKCRPRAPERCPCVRQGWERPC